MFGTKRVFGINMWDHVQSACNLKVLLRISGSRDPRDKHKTWTLSQFSSYVCPKVIHDLKSSCLSLANIFRLVQGLLQSPCFPSLNPLTNRWGRQTSNQVSKLKAAVWKWTWKNPLQMGSRVREGKVCDFQLQRRHSWCHHHLPIVR